MELVQKEFDRRKEHLQTLTNNLSDSISGNEKGTFI